MKLVLFFAILLIVSFVLQPLTLLDSNGSSLDWEWINDGEGIENAIASEEPSLYKDVYYQEEYAKNFPYPSFFHYNSSFQLGRDEKNSAIWFSLRLPVKYGDRATWPEELPGYYIRNSTKISALIIVQNVKIKRIIKGISVQTFPLYIGTDGPRSDGLDTPDSPEDGEDYVEIIDENTLYIDIFTEYQHDNFGIELEILSHPATLEVMPAESDPSNLFHEWSTTARELPDTLTTDNFFIGPDKEKWEYGDKIPLTRSLTIGGIPQSEPNQIIDINFDPVSNPSFDFSSFLSLSVSSSLVLSKTAVLVAASFSFFTQVARMSSSAQRNPQKRKKKKDNIITSALKKNILR